MYIGGAGMVCPVGLYAASACAAMRAGISGFSELPYLDNLGQPVTGAVVPGFEPGVGRVGRLTQMLSRALEDLLGNQPALDTGTIPLLVGMAEPQRPGGGVSTTEWVVPAIEGALKRRFHDRFSQVLAKGHTAGFELLRTAREILQRTNLDACIVAAVDSCANASTLHWLEQCDRLKTPQNSNGVIPGEAASAVLVLRKPYGNSFAMKVSGMGFAKEQSHVMSEDPFLGLGLAKASRLALAESGDSLHEVSFRLSDATGESYGFKEQALLLSRVMRGRRKDFPIWHCAESIGDTGAAAGVCHMVSAFQAFARGYAPGDRAMAFGSSVGGDRAAVVLKRC